MEKQGIQNTDGTAIYAVPINMRDGSVLAVGRGNSDWNYSAPHGAGRQVIILRQIKPEYKINRFEEGS